MCVSIADTNLAIDSAYANLKAPAGKPTVHRRREPGVKATGLRERLRDYGKIPVTKPAVRITEKLAVL